MKKRVLLWMAGLVFAVTSLFAQDIPVGGQGTDNKTRFIPLFSVATRSVVLM